MYLCNNDNNKIELSCVILTKRMCKCKDMNGFHAGIRINHCELQGTNA